MQVMADRLDSEMLRGFDNGWISDRRTFEILESLLQLKKGGSGKNKTVGHFMLLLHILQNILQKC